MAIGRSRNSSLNFEVLLLFLLCLYAIIFHLQSCILNPPSDISVFPRAHATVFVNNRRPLSSLHSSHHGRRILRLPSKAGLPSKALTSMRCGLLSYTICCFCMLVSCGGCPGESWTCCQLYPGRFFYCKVKRQERHHDRSHERSRPLRKFSPSEATGFQY